MHYNLFSIAVIYMHTTGTLFYAQNYKQFWITVPVGVEVERMMNTVIHNENGGGNKTCKRIISV